MLLSTPMITQIYSLSLHDALPILNSNCPYIQFCTSPKNTNSYFPTISRSEEHTSELQSRFDLVCRLLLEKIKNLIINHSYFKCHRIIRNSSKYISYIKPTNL